MRILNLAVGKSVLFSLAQAVERFLGGIESDLVALKS
jgi:hypothetical protein